MIFNALKKTRKVGEGQSRGRAECSADATFNLGPRVERTRGRQGSLHGDRGAGRNPSAQQQQREARSEREEAGGEAALWAVAGGPLRAVETAARRPGVGREERPGYTRCSGANPAGDVPQARAAAEVSPHGAETEPREVSIPPWMRWLSSTASKSEAVWESYPGASTFSVWNALAFHPKSPWILRKWGANSQRGRTKTKRHFGDTDPGYHTLLYKNSWLVCPRK